MIDQIYARTKTKILSSDYRGEFVLVNPGKESIIITDLNIDIDKNAVLNKKSSLVIKVKDDKREFILCNIPLGKVYHYNYHNQGLAQLWRGARIEIVKLYEGNINVVLNYLTVTGKDYHAWS